MIADDAFHPACSRQAFLETTSLADALRRLEAGLGAREPFVLVTGEPGTGKSTLLAEALARLEGRVAAARVAYATLSGTERLEEIVLRFGGEPDAGASRPRLVACLECTLAAFAAAGRTAIVVVDDAHDLERDALEELRLLANTARQSGHGLEIWLAGLPALAARLAEPALAPLAQRVAVRVEVAPLSEGEARRYLRQRVDAAGGDGAQVFSRKGAQAIAALAHGVPRRLNTLAAEALRIANAAGAATVQPPHAQAAAQALWGEGATVVLPVRAGDEDETVGAAANAAPQASKPEPATAPPERAKPAPTPSPAAASPAAPAPPARQDPSEWVARFVGDRGPVVIGAQVGATASTGAARGRESAEAGGTAAGPRLAAALAAHASPSPRHRARRLRAASIALLAGTAAVVVAVLAWRATHATNAHPHAVAATAAPKPAATATASPAPVVTTVPKARAARADSAAAPAVITSPSGKYTLEIGAFADLDDAIRERNLAEQVTGIEGWVVPAPEGSGRLHRVILGIYRSQERAVSAAKMLVETKTLPRATAAALPPRGARL